MNLKEIYKTQLRVADMANFYHDFTGVDAVIWVSPKYAGYKPRVKITKGDDSASMSIEDEPEILAPKNSKLDASIINAAKQWIVLNKETLIGYWDMEFDTSVLVSKLKKL
ncbi:MAG TPA: hypothetical protein IAC93_01360 [Candidatus Limisoma gallistercoris]|nr:hypothetical protein [Candidatus Limisoma gallistercoris]